MGMHEDGNRAESRVQRCWRHFCSKLGTSVLHLWLLSAASLPSPLPCAGHPLPPAPGAAILRPIGTSSLSSRFQSFTGTVMSVVKAAPCSPVSGGSIATRDFWAKHFYSPTSFHISLSARQLPGPPRSLCVMKMCSGYT